MSQTIDSTRYCYLEKHTFTCNSILKECTTDIFLGISLLLKDTKYAKVDTNTNLRLYCKIS